VLVPLVNVAQLPSGTGARRTSYASRANPLVLACAAGLLVERACAAGSRRGHARRRTARRRCPAARPLLAVGAGLRVRGTDLPPRAIAWWNGVKLVALPALALAFARLFG